MRALFCLVIFCFMVSFVSAQGSPFLQHNILSTLPLASGIGTGDIDEDGLPDVVVGSGANTGNTVRWCKNMGTDPLTWETFDIDNAISAVMSAQVADLNGDGHPDITVAAWVSGQIAVYYSSGTNPITWQKQLVGTSFLGAHEVYADDLDNDGDLDLMGAAAASHEIAVWLNQGGNPVAWQKYTLSQNYGGARSVFSTDLNADGVKEVIGAGLTNNRISYWKQMDFEPYWEEVIVADDFVGAHRVRVCDLDNDGHPDILGEAYTSGKVAWWKNSGTEPPTFQKYVIDASCTLCLDIVAADFNGDGNQEIVSSSQNTATLAIYYPTADPAVWTKEILTNTYTDPWRLQVCDLDGDQDIDILSGAYQPGTVDYWENFHYGCYFSADRNSGQMPFTANFTSVVNSVEPFTDFEWDFNGDWVIDSNEQNPSYTFSEPGQYSVTLIASNSTTSKTFTREDYITVFNGETALSFANLQALASAEASPDLNLTQALTLEAWIYPTGWGTNNAHGFGRIIDKQKFALYIKKESNILNTNCLIFQLTNENNVNYFCYTPENSIQLNVWQHVAVSYDGNGNVKMYIDGMEQVVEYSTTAPSGLITDNAANALHIGAGFSNSNIFQGVIDEVRIWNSVRSLEDLTQFMNQIIPVPHPDMKAYYQFNDAWGNIAQDNSNHAHPLTLSFIAWVQGAELGHPQGIEDGSIPMSSFGLTAYPNPFNPEINLTLEIKKQNVYKLLLYNARGQLVKVITDQILQPGQHKFTWNGVSQSGKRAASGIYFCKLSSGNSNILKKIILLK